MKTSCGGKRHDDYYTSGRPDTSGIILRNIGLAGYSKGWPNS